MLIASFLLPTLGTKGGYLLFAGIDLLLLMCLPLMPVSYQLSEEQEQRAAPPLSGIIGLVGVALFLAGIMAFWVYVLPLGAELNYPKDALNFSVSMAIGAQIIAGLCAIALAARLKPIVACIGGSGIAALAIALFTQVPEIFVLYTSLALFSFVWMFVPPFQMPLLIELDPSLRSAMFIGTAQLGGVALGPIIAAQLISSESTGMAATGAIIAVAVSALLLIGARLSKT